MKMKKKTLSVQKKTGILSTAITLIIVACLVLLNVAATVLTEKYPVKIDLTSNKVFQLSQASIDYLQDLDKDVKITVLNTKDGFIRQGDYYSQAMSVMEQYTYYNPKIQLEFIDLLANPAYASRYPDLQVSLNDILVQSGEHTEKLTAYDLFNIQMSWYGGDITSSKAEEAMTGAIMNVANDQKVKVAFLTGHGESGAEGLKELFKKNGFDTADASLLTEGVPQDAGIAVLSAPTRDITKDEAASLDQFMENNGLYGKYLLYFASLDQGSLPNLEEWLAKWGIRAGQGAVAETSPNRVVNNNAYFGIADFDDQTFIAKMQSLDIPIAVPFTRPIEFTFTSSMGYTTNSLLSYSESAGIVGDEVQRLSDIQVSGPITVAGMSTYQKDGASSSVLAFGTPTILDSGLLGNGSLSNADYLLSMANTLTKREDVISIAPKTLGGGSIAITKAQVLFLALIFMIVLPLATLIVGITIWVRRKHR